MPGRPGCAFSRRAVSTLSMPGNYQQQFSIWSK
jgi:hypothetical protein